MRALPWIALTIAACSSARLSSQESGQPTMVWPARFAEGSNDGGGAAADAGAPERTEVAQRPPTYLPDPTPLSVREQYEYELRYRDGTVEILRVRARTFEKPLQTAREMGRFALELWIGHELIDRVRFDFPLLAAEPAPTGRRRPLEEPPTLAAATDLRRTILVPRSDRATSARIVDRATGSVTSVPWPPEAPLDAPAKESGLP